MIQTHHQFWSCGFRKLGQGWGRVEKRQQRGGKLKASSKDLFVFQMMTTFEILGDAHKVLWIL